MNVPANALTTERMTRRTPEPTAYAANTRSFTVLTHRTKSRQTRWNSESKKQSRAQQDKPGTQHGGQSRVAPINGRMPPPNSKPRPRHLHIVLRTTHPRTFRSEGPLAVSQRGSAAPSLSRHANSASERKPRSWLT